MFPPFSGSAFHCRIKSSCSNVIPVILSLQEDKDYLSLPKDKDHLKGGGFGLFFSLLSLVNSLSLNIHNA